MPPLVSLTQGKFAPLPPAGSDELAIARQIANQIKHATAVAAASPEAVFHPDSYAAMAQRFLKAKPGRQALARPKAAALLAAAPAARQQMFGRFAGRGIQVHKQPGLLDRELIAERAAALAKKKPKLSIHFDPAFVDAMKPRYKKLGFFIHHISCVEETSEVGSDEILLSGLGIAPTGAVLPVPVWKVSDDFDEGETVVCSPPACSSSST